MLLVLLSFFFFALSFFLGQKKVFFKGFKRRMASLEVRSELFFLLFELRDKRVVGRVDVLELRNFCLVVRVELIVVFNELFELCLGFVEGFAKGFGVFLCGFESEFKISALFLAA